MKVVSLLIVSDEAIGREGLCALLHRGPGFEVVGDAGTVSEATSLLVRTPVDVVIVDFVLPICAIDAGRRILAESPSSHVIVLSAYADEPRVADLLAAELRKLNVSGFLPRNTPSIELIGAIQRVATGESVFPTSSAVPPTATPSFPRTPSIQLPSLTLRQSQVLKLVAEGLANKQIADRLQISPKTVEKHRQSVKEKLHTNNAADLTRRAIGLGLIAAEPLI